MTISFAPPNAGLHLYADEAGDLGIKTLQSNSANAREWFVLGALVVDCADKSKLFNWCDEIKSQCGVYADQPLHYRYLKGDNKLKACRLLAQLPVRAFIYCSNKRNLRGYENERAGRSSNEKNWYYNSGVKYLLERATEFASEWNNAKTAEAKHLEVKVAERADISGSKLRIYLDEEAKRIRSAKNFHDVRPMKWEVLNSSLIGAADGRTDAGLQLADIIASAFYAAVEEDGHNVAYDLSAAKALFPVVWDGTLGNQQRQFYENNGLTLFPSGYWVNLNSRQHEIFDFYNFDLRSRWLRGPPK